MSKKYKVSVQMAVYNVEPYIDEAIESIINQDIGFKENVQLILINDGSTDDSESHCLKYANRYPDNILYIKKENGGLSSVRNAGLKHTNAQYVTFTDPDDTLEPNTLSEVYNFMEEHRDEIDQAGIPLYFFEAATGLHQKYRYFDFSRGNRVVDLMEEPYNFILSAASMFYKSEVITKIHFDENVYGCEDIKVNLELYSHNHKIGFVCEHGVKYNYRQRFAKTSIINTLKSSLKAYRSVMDEYEHVDLNNLKPYEKEVLIYELRSRIKGIQRSTFENEEDYNGILNGYKQLINHIDNDFIVYESKWADLNIIKEFFLNCNNSSLKYYIDKKDYQEDLEVYAKDYFVQDGKFIVDTVFPTFGSKLELIAKDGNGEIYYPVKKLDFDSPQDPKYGEFSVDKTHYRRFEFDLTNKVIKFYLYKGSIDDCILVEQIRADANSSLALRSNSIYMNREGKSILFNGKKFKIFPKEQKEGLLYKLKTIAAIYANKHYLPLMRLWNHKNKKYILINDRPEKAGDNGEALFKYINKYEPQMAKNTYFVIDKNCDDYQRMKKYGKVVNIRSFKHKRLFMNAKYIYSSHNARNFFNAYPLNRVIYYKDMFNYQFVWLQHGITKDDISNDANRLTTKNNYVVAATNGEYNEFMQDKYFLNDGRVILTGFARFDYLENEPKNIIAICPTWRKNLTGKILPDGTHETLADFDKTDYYKNYEELLTNTKLNKLLKDNNYVLQFILHPGVSGYKEYFDKFENDNIKIIPQSEVSYNQVFKESKLLITDYSSVFFDFAYLKKPEIFFQFDNDTFFEKHYKKGYFEYKKDAFGDVLVTPKEVIDKIEYYFKNDFKMEDKYIKRVENTFKFIDKDNCKRIIDSTYKK